MRANGSICTLLVDKLPVYNSIWTLRRKSAIRKLSSSSSWMKQYSIHSKIGQSEISNRKSTYWICSLCICSHYFQSTDYSRPWRIALFVSFPIWTTTISNCSFWLKNYWVKIKSDSNRKSITLYMSLIKLLISCWTSNTTSSYYKFKIFTKNTTYSM